jgi:hypothetical protein
MFHVPRVDEYTSFGSLLQFTNVHGNSVPCERPSLLLHARSCRVAENVNGLMFLTGSCLCLRFVVQAMRAAMRTASL